MEAQRVFERLLKGNERYRKSERMHIDVSAGHRQMLVENGQHPFAAIICCSDSTVIPEAIFSCGVGELFVIRTLGNVVGRHELAGIEYAVTKLEVPLVFVLGHDHCGAMAAMLGQNTTMGFLSSITSEIREGTDDVKDPLDATRYNVRHGIENIKNAVKSFQGKKRKFALCGGIYHQISGKVEVIV